MPLSLVTGDDIAIPVTLTKDDATFVIDECAIVKAAIVDIDHTEVLAGPVTLDHSTAGSEWAQSTVMVTFESADTAAVTASGPAYVEVQVNDAGKLTWFAPVLIVLGQIA